MYKEIYFLFFAFCLLHCLHTHTEVYYMNLLKNSQRYLDLFTSYLFFLSIYQHYLISTSVSGTQILCRYKASLSTWLFPTCCLILD